MTLSLMTVLPAMERSMCRCAHGCEEFAAMAPLTQDYLESQPLTMYFGQVRAVKRAGRLPGIRSSETRIMPTGTSSDSNSPPTERIY